jgi:hypothetical protein
MLQPSPEHKVPKLPPMKKVRSFAHGTTKKIKSWQTLQLKNFHLRQELLFHLFDIAQNEYGIDFRQNKPTEIRHNC